MIYIRDNWLYTINIWQYFNFLVFFSNFDENNHLFHHICIELIQYLFLIFIINLKNLNTLSTHSFTHVQSIITTEYSLLQYIKINKCSII